LKGDTASIAAALAQIANIPDGLGKGQVDHSCPSPVGPGKR
jgi:hypothetical protein